MGGKNLKFPRRAKYQAPDKEIELEEKPVSEEEHQKRLEVLKGLGLLK